METLYNKQTKPLPHQESIKLGKWIGINQHEILFAVIFILIQPILIIPPWQHLQEKYRSFEHHRTETLRNSYNISVEFYNKTATLLYTEIINREEILHWVALANTTEIAQQNHARQQLYQALKETYQNLQYLDLRQLHFQLPDGTSFLRFHRPDKFGDKLFDVRYSLMWANTHKKSIFGFEEGRIYNGFRYVFPLFYENKHIGSVETSVAFPAIEKVIKQIIRGEFMLLLKKQMVTDTVFASEQDNYQPVTLNDAYVEETVAMKNHKEIPSLLLAQINRQLRPKIHEQLKAEQSFIADTRVEGKDYIATFIPISNVQQQNVGYLVAYDQNSELRELHFLFYQRYAELGAINILIFVFFISVLRSKNHIALQNTHLSALMQDKNELMGIVAHDLKNPLSAIKGYAEELHEAADEMTLEDICLYASKIEDSSQRMFSLISNLLDINAVESGKMKIVRQKTSLGQVLAECVARHQDRAIQKHITLEFSGTACSVETDAQLFHQIMDNLISNAIKYSPPRTRVSVQVSIVDGKIYCVVEDQGPGLSIEDQAKLFGKFTRLTPIPTAGEHSTGLGLFIVKKLVDTLKGKIWCESQLGQGSRFIVQLCCCMD